MSSEDFTVAQVARLLGRSIRSVQVYVKQGKFPNARKIGDGGRTSAYLIPKSDVDAYLKKKRPQPPKG